MPDGDKRRQRRLNVAGPVTISTASGQQVAGEAINVSLLGCRLSSPTLLTVGEPIALTLRFPSGKSHVVEGTITTVTQHPPYQYGVAFTSETVERLLREEIKPV